MFTRRKLQITMALTLLFAMLISATAANAQAVTLGGTATIRDASGSALGASNSLALGLTDAPSAGSGFRYEGWLVSSSGAKVSVGTFNGPSINGTWVSPTNENLAATYVQLVLTKEPVPDPDPATSGAPAFSATIAAGVLGPFRSLLTASGSTASGNGLAVALHGQASVAAAHAALSKDSAVLADMQSHAQHVINVIDGLGGPGDGIGILAYADDAKAQAAAAKVNGPDNATVVAGADAVIAAADEIIVRAESAKASAQLVIALSPTTSPTGALADAYTGTVLSQSGLTVTAAANLYAAAQDMGAFVPTDGSVPTPPSAGDELVPMIALLVLAAGVLFTGGGFAMLRRRGVVA
ncbi:MAG: hypothetical protein O2826_05005 [Chloroflexi bacterium]|nr:hypothetical protein [Chloroflexota bacterium]MDA1173862.1 hypothetical protein [Chloroflexota bacterium]